MIKGRYVSHSSALAHNGLVGDFQVKRPGVGKGSVVASTIQGRYIDEISALKRDNWKLFEENTKLKRQLAEFNRQGSQQTDGAHTAVRSRENSENGSVGDHNQEARIKELEDKILQQRTTIASLTEVQRLELDFKGKYTELDAKVTTLNCRVEELELEVTTAYDAEFVYTNAYQAVAFVVKAFVLALKQQSSAVDGSSGSFESWVGEFNRTLASYSNTSDALRFCYETAIEISNSGDAGSSQYSLKKDSKIIRVLDALAKHVEAKGDQPDFNPVVALLDEISNEPKLVTDHVGGASLKSSESTVSDLQQGKDYEYQRVVDGLQRTPAQGKKLDISPWETPTAEDTKVKTSYYEMLDRFQKLGYEMHDSPVEFTDSLVHLVTNSLLAIEGLVSEKSGRDFDTEFKRLVTVGENLVKSRNDGEIPRKKLSVDDLAFSRTLPDPLSSPNTEVSYPDTYDSSSSPFSQGNVIGRRLSDSSPISPTNFNVRSLTGRGVITQRRDLLEFSRPKGVDSLLFAGRGGGLPRRNSHNAGLNQANGSHDTIERLSDSVSQTRSPVKVTFRPMENPGLKGNDAFDEFVEHRIDVASLNLSSDDSKRTASAAHVGLRPEVTVPVVGRSDMGCTPEGCNVS